MKRNWIPQTQTMEMISANLRWFIVAVCLFIVYTPSINGFLGYSKAGFTWTALFVVLYTAVDQYVLLRYPVTSSVYKVVTRTSIVMDGVAVLALVAMTGGGHSPFYMVFYLLLLHSAIYWNLAGALYAAGLLTGGYSVMLLRLDPGVFTDPYRLYLYSLQVMFTFVIAFYCGVIASRERKQFKDSNYYRDRLNEDYLTGLFNHRYFQETMDRIYRERQPAYLIMADIDHFKTINDTYGHATGDEVLRQVSGVLSARLRDRNGLAFRYGERSSPCWSTRGSRTRPPS
ncbi:GGDEF domain-containing protein [Paenibacillus sp. CC-CFT747]|nr:GGDEF domain-containing protein [Paenibacillus sp. CC-CFT747]